VISVSSLNVNISSVFYNSNYSSFVAFHFIYNTQSLGNGIAITFFGNSHFFEITNGIIGNITKQSVVDEFEIAYQEEAVPVDQ
jgi:hypothetical protein